MWAGGCVRPAAGRRVWGVAGDYYRAFVSVAVSELVAEVRARVVRHRRVELSVPMDVPPSLVAAFHFVAAGRARVEGPGGGRALAPGDLAVVPRGPGHRVVPVPIGARSAVLLSGAAAFDPVDAAALALLPELFVVPVGEGWLGPLLVTVDPADLPGRAATMVARLADVLVGHAIRVWLLTHPLALRGLAGALGDEHLGRALDLIHRHPTRPWTVASLAAETGLSRSRFAQRFAGAVGRTPMAYLADVRMRLATDLIFHEGLSAAEAAARTGYGSAVAFSRAYKRLTGRTPDMTRRRAAASRATTTPVLS